MMKTYSAKPADIQRKWWIIDAEDVVLGRLATKAATILRGKHKTMYTPHMDCGDNVIIVNADKIHITGNKRTDRVYYRHTGYPGGIKSTTPEELFSKGQSETVVKKAVERMISRNPLGTKQFSKLYVYPGAEHPHEAQKPEAIDFKSQNRKNAK